MGQSGLISSVANAMQSSPSIPSALIAALWALAITTGSAEAETIVLKGATTIDVLANRALPDSVIVIEGDKIVSFGGKGTPYPANASVISLKDKYIIPGLIDGHSHYLSYTGEMYLNYGVTSLLAMGPVRSQVGDAYWGQTRQPDFRAPRLFGAGHEPLAPLRSDMSREEVQAAVATFVAGDPDFANTPTYTQANKQVWRWEVEFLHAAGIAVFGHTTNASVTIPLGQDVLEHVWGVAQALMSQEEYASYRKGGYLHWASFLKDRAGSDRMIHEAVLENEYLNPTMVYNFSSLSAHASQYQTLMSALYNNGALMSYFPPNMADGYQLRMRSAWLSSTRYSTYVPLADMAPRDLLELEQDKLLIDQFVHRWVAAGGKIVGGTDDPYVGTPGLSVHLEMAMLVEAGLTPLQALKAMTVWPGDVMIKRRLRPTKARVGYIGPGAYADLVVLSRNPLTDIDNSRSIERVMKGGAFVTLGYTPSYPQQRPVPLRVIPTIAVPELSGITPNTVAEGGPSFQMTVDGNGFNVESVVRVDGTGVPTTFVDSRRLMATIPASSRISGQDNSFRTFGFDQYPGVYGDHTAKINVYNQGLDGGTSNDVYLRVQEPWLDASRR
jgi:hypothetical protein